MSESDKSRLDEAVKRAESRAAVMQSLKLSYGGGSKGSASAIQPAMDMEPKIVESNRNDTVIAKEKVKEVQGHLNVTSRAADIIIEVILDDNNFVEI